MGQWEVHNLLKENREKWFTARQISELLGVSFASVVNGVKKLRKSGLVEFRKVQSTSTQRGSFKDAYAYRYKEA